MASWIFRGRILQCRFFFFQAEDGIRAGRVTGVQTCALPISFPAARVVMTAAVMVDPALVAGGQHTMFVAGNDADARTLVSSLLRDGFGWKHVLDLGDLTAARGMEMYVPQWLRIMQAQRTPMFNIAVAT